VGGASRGKGVSLAVIVSVQGFGYCCCSLKGTGCAVVLAQPRRADCTLPPDTPAPAPANLMCWASTRSLHMQPAAASWGELLQ